MKIMQTSLFGLLLILPFLFIDCTHSVSEPEEKELPPPCKALCGQAFLQGYNDHRGIFIYNRDHVGAGGLTQTDSNGNFELPLPSDGKYTLFATYALFFPDTAVVEIADSTVKNPPRMTLVQYLKTRIIPDTTVFFLSDSIRLKVEMTNLLDRIVYGPGEIRYDQVWLRDLQDTTKIFQHGGPRHLPGSASYAPYETKFFRFAAPGLNFRLFPPPGGGQKVVVPPGIYQAWLADRFYVDPGQHMDLAVFTFGDSFGPAKGWITIQIK